MFGYVACLFFFLLFKINYKMQKNGFTVMFFVNLLLYLFMKLL